MSEYIDENSAYVVRGAFASCDRFGDGVWRSSWFYACALLLAEHDISAYDAFANEQQWPSSGSGALRDLVARFVRFFRTQCVKEDHLLVHPECDQAFSRDQLAPLLLLLFVARGVAHDDDVRAIVDRIVQLDRTRGNLALPGHESVANGRLHPGLSYCILVLAERVDGLDKCDYGRHWRSVWKHSFTFAIASQASALHLLPSAVDDYSLFNSCALVVLQTKRWGRDDGDVRQWRAALKPPAELGWGPVFAIVADAADAPTLEQIDADWRAVRMRRSDDNDIIVAQRARRIASGELAPARLRENGGESKTLDWLILRALRGSMIA